MQPDDNKLKLKIAGNFNNYLQIFSLYNISFEYNKINILQYTIIHTGTTFNTGK